MLLRRTSSTMAGHGFISADSTLVFLTSAHDLEVGSMTEGASGTMEVRAGPIKGISRMREKVMEYEREEDAESGGLEGSGWPQAARVLDPLRASVVVCGPELVLPPPDPDFCRG